MIFNIQYTPYHLPRSASYEQKLAHAEARAFYDMTGGKNVFTYMTTEGKRTGKRTALEYLQKNTGVFNDHGMLSERQVEEMKGRLRQNQGYIWHGFVSLNAEQSPKIDTPEKCIELVKRTFPSFLKDAKLDPDNVDLMCALHLDRPHHLHIHFVFWEKEPKFKGGDGALRFRRAGKIQKAAIDNLFVRLGLFLSDRREVLYKRRDEALREMKCLLGARAFVHRTEDIKREIVSLAKDLPKTGRLSYGSRDMEPYRERVDRIVKMLLSTDARAKRADNAFYLALTERSRQVKNICGIPVSFSDQNVKPEEMEYPHYHNKIDEENIHIIDELEADYKRRQGNLVLNLAKFIKPEYYENRRKRKANDTSLKRSVGMSRRKIDGMIKKFLSSFGQESEYLKRDFFNRLREIEEEQAREREQRERSPTDVADRGKGG